jgi:hypothetical protein
MNDVERIERYALLSGFTGPSLDEARREFPRMASFMHRQGIHQIPDSPFTADARTSSMLILLLRQASKVRDASIEHDLRNLTGIRPWKL